MAARSSLSKPDCSRTLVRVCDSCVTDWRKRLRVAAGPRENKPLRSSKVARYTRQSWWTVRRLIIIAIVNRLALRHANPKEQLGDPQRASGLTGAGDRPLLCRAHSLGPMRRIRGGPTACPRNVLRNDKLDVPTFDIMSVLLVFALLAFIEKDLLFCIFGIHRGQTRVRMSLESWIADLGNTTLPSSTRAYGWRRKRFLI
jgi:hypothetical protein